MGLKYLLAFALLLVGCEQQVGDDGYVFEKAEFNRTTVTVTVHEYKSFEALQREADRRNIEVEKVGGFGIVSLTEPKCDIFIVDPAISNKRVWPGHEFVHCIKGRWHS